jgi:hypothetical protein
MSSPGLANHSRDVERLAQDGIKLIDPRIPAMYSEERQTCWPPSMESSAPLI